MAKIKLKEIERFLYEEADDFWGYPAQIDDALWQRYCALRDELLALNGQIEPIYEAVESAYFAAQPKTGHSQSKCPNGGLCGDCLLEGNETTLPHGVKLG